MRAVLLCSLVGGILGAASVIAGHALRIPGYCGQTGFWGTHFLDSMLYAMGNDRVAIAMVLLVYFVYGALAGAGIGMFLGPRRRKG